MKKLFWRYFWGLLLIAIGVGYLGNHLGLWSGFTVFFDGWWAILFIVIPAIMSMINNRINTTNTLAALIGILLFLSQTKRLAEVPVGKIALCAVVIFMGIRLILKPTHRRKKRADLRYVNEEAEIDKQRVLFGSDEISFRGRTFGGGNYSVSFGALSLDLREATLSHDCEIHIDVVFGAVELLLPEGTVVINDTNSLCGVVNIQRGRHTDPNLPKIFLCGTCTFGGAEVK